MTKRELYTAAMTIIATADITEEQRAEMAAGFEHEIEMLDKKAASKSDKPSERQVENSALKDIILQTLEDASEPITIKTIKASHPSLSALEGSQKISSLLSQLRKEGKVRRSYVKKVAHFELGVDDIYAE